MPQSPRSFDATRMPAVPRRTLMAGAAWSVPVVAAAGAAPAYATSICSTLYDYNLAWGSVRYDRSNSGVASYATLPSVQAGGDTIYVHFNTVATAANAIDTTRNLTLSDGGNNTTQDPTVTNLGATGQRGIRLQHNNVRQSGLGTADANAQTLKVSFRSGISPTSPLVYVRNVSFYMTDIDALSGGNNYSDRMSLFPNPTTSEQVRDTNVAATVSGGGTANVTVTGVGTDANPWRLVQAANNNNASNANIAETSAGTRVRVTYENTSARVMQELTLKYWSGVNTTIYHRVYLTNFTFKARRLYCG